MNEIKCGSDLYLARSYQYAMAGNGYCTDWVYLPEGAYPSLLRKSDTLYDENRITECMNRCIDASIRGLSGSRDAVDTPIRDHAFYIRQSDQGCGCSSGECSERMSTGYASYYTVSGNSQTIIFGVWSLYFIKTYTSIES